MTLSHSGFYYEKNIDKELKINEINNFIVQSIANQSFANSSFIIHHLILFFKWQRIYATGYLIPQTDAFFAIHTPVNA